MVWKGSLNFIISEFHTGFIIDFIIYIDQQTEVQLDRELDMSGSIVMTLMNSYLDKDHVVFANNWYTSSALFQKPYFRRAGNVSLEVTKR
jgi:hypothetical protein